MVETGKISKRLQLIAVLLAFCALTAGSAPVRLGIIVEDPLLSTAADLLTAELSHEPQLSLLERAEISVVLKEQGLSAAHGGDFVKLGQLLGADGLLFLDVVSRGTNQFVTTRLAAVKPGVVLDLAEYPLPEAEQWRELLVKRLGSLFPKLSVLARDAIPISFLNIRAAVKSTDGEALERELSRVLFSRLMHQPEVFVLERQKLQSLAEEKDMKGLGKEPFWNGSYLLEGTIDKAGFKAGMITITMRLTPPGQITPIEIEAAGPRKEAAILASGLGGSILARLRVQTGIQDWKVEDEAARYFAEAKWAWRWSMVPEALAAADAAWALGRKDLECGTIRVNAATSLAIHQTPLEQQKRLQRAIFTPSAPPAPPRMPEQKDIEMAARSLANYEELHQVLPPDEPKLDSPAFGLGIETLNAASRLLWILHRNSELEQEMKKPLAELRSRLREVAAWLSGLPSVRAEYWPAASAPRQVREVFVKQYDLLLCETDYARLWHERPEDCLPLYREMMSSPTFVRLHSRLGPDALSAWTVQDKERSPTVWSNFVQQLCISTNPLLRAEGRIYAFAQVPSGKGLAVVDAASVRQAEERRKQAADAALSELLATNPVPVAGASPYRLAPELAGALAGSYAEISSEYQRRRDEHEQDLSVKEQKFFLANDTSFAFTNIARVFSRRNYTPEQARELEPLVTVYKSNLLAVLQVTQRLRQSDVTWGSMMHIESVESRIRQILGLAPLPPARLDGLQTARTGLTNRPLPRSAQTNLVQNQKLTAPRPALSTGPQPSVPPTNAMPNSIAPLASWPTSTSRRMRLTDDERGEALVMTARFHKIPLQGIRPSRTNVTHWLNSSPTGPFRVSVEGHRVMAGKIWFDIRFGYALDTNWRGALAVWDPSTRSPVVSAATLTNGWRVIHYPSDKSRELTLSRGEDEAVNGVHFELFKGSLYLSVWHQAMQRYHLEKGVWEALPIPVSKPTQLLALRDRLFAANDESIYEILDDGRRTHLLASCRRRPSASTLDSLNSLETPTLFLGPQNSLRASVGDKVYAWNDRDWAEVFSLADIAAPSVFEDTIIFRSKAPPTASFWYLPRGGAKPELYWQETWTKAPYNMGGFGNSYSAVNARTARQRSANPVLSNAGVLSEGSSLYFLARHLDRAGNPDGQADLIRLERGSWKPLLIPVQMPPGFQLTPDFTFIHRFPWMTSLPGMLLIGQPGQAGVVTLPWKDVETAFDAEKARQRRGSAE